MKVFIESTACTSRMHCGTCRDLKGGRAWRRGLAEAFTLPVLAPDFECPYGLPWGHTADPPTLGTKVAHGVAGIAKAATGRDPVSLDVLNARQAVCNACPEKTAALGGVTTKCRLCGCVLPAKQRLASERCPVGKWEPVSSAPPAAPAEHRRSP